MKNEFEESLIAMQRIESLINQIKTIMTTYGISQNSIIAATENKCSRTTIINFLSGESDFKISTLLLVLEVIGADLRIETEKSKQALMSGDIAAYRDETEKLRAELNNVSGQLEFFKHRYEELIDKNTELTSIANKQQVQIERYMGRTERAEDALYAANADIRRKDARIVELSKQLNKW